MSNRDDRIKELTKRLNHLRLDRKEIAKKEQVVYHELRNVVFGQKKGGKKGVETCFF